MKTLAIVLMLFAQAIPAAEFIPPDRIILNKEEIAACAQGCLIITEKELEGIIMQQMEKAFNAGKSTCKKWKEA